MRSVVRSLQVTTVLAFVALAVLTSSSSALPVTGTHPWVVVLCNFSDDTAQPQTVGYYQQMFNGAPNGDGLKEYFNDVSYGNLEIDGTVVKGWYTLGMTRYQFSGLSRFHKIEVCAQAADPDVDYHNYWGVFVMTNFPVDGLPAAVTTTVPGGVADATTTTVTVASTAGFPSPPFAIVVDDGTTDDIEEMNVTGVSGNDLTVVRGYEFGTANAHNAGANVTLVYGSDYGNVGLDTLTFNVDGGVKLGNVVGGYTFNAGGAAHEMGHGFGFIHSRKLSDSTNDYNDCWDIMSIFSCVYTFQGSFGGTNLNSQVAAAGDGFTAINVDLGGWLDHSRLLTHDNSACNQTTISLAGLNHPEVSGYLAARIPDVTTIPIPNSMTTSSDYLWLEHRDKSGWDRGIPANAVVLHLHGADNRAYWVDSAGGGDGKLDNGQEYVDAARNVYIAVNSINSGTHLAKVTIAGCKIDPTFTYTGDTTGDFDDLVTLAGDLTVGGAPVPNASVTLSLGSQSCLRTTDVNGHASCSVRIDQHPGTYTATGSYAGDAAYNSASDPDTGNFTITKEETQLVYSGATSSDYHDPFTATATLTDPVDSTPIAGKTVTFELGTGDTCSDTTDSSGVASCSVTPTQVPGGSYSVKASFGPDQDYEDASTTASFTITKEETTLAYTGPTVVLAGSGTTATLSAHLVEDGANDDDGDGGSPAPVPAGQTITFTLGGQSCSDTTDSSGDASCTITDVSGSALGPKTLDTTFAGDDYYLGSSDSDQVIVFAFPRRGAFVLGDDTVAAAGSTDTLTWWSDSWWSSDNLSGGVAPASFKGFAADVTTLPTTSPASSCGTTFETRPGNSPLPPSDVPSYMGVLVASSVTKSGSTIGGTWGKIVVVETDPGYASSPGHQGTGTIVATFCP